MRRTIAEWERQRAVLMAFPHADTDWAENLEAALTPFIRIAQAIAYAQPLYIICRDKKSISDRFCTTRNMSFIEIPTNDTWIRDYGYISIEESGETKLLDFSFDGWGGKFDASLDNLLNRVLYQKGYLGTTPLESIDFVLEGGSIESDGAGTIMTTSRCLCNRNRNGGLSQDEVASKLSAYLGADRILWLNSGYLAGDDTDSHIDTLARFVDKESIAYLKCDNRGDEHYIELQKMEDELKNFRTIEEEPYRLIPLPMCEARYDQGGSRLPATYANFLITNRALIYPTYNAPTDREADSIFKEIFPDKEIIPINCEKLIEEGGSLHCSTMQIAQ
ncbi:MAG: agmatine deiminase family protein [Campylobacterota bacterium]|nr:agmatine deiminase family protein [Campylobacterota bacterium]